VVDATERPFLISLKEGQGLATREIAAIIVLSTQATRTQLSRLIDGGLVLEIGTRAKGPQRKYFLAGVVHHQPHTGAGAGGARQDRLGPEG
jgi:hypothetical protein